MSLHGGLSIFRCPLTGWALHAQKGGWVVPFLKQGAPQLSLLEFMDFSHLLVSTIAKI